MASLFTPTQQVLLRPKSGACAGVRSRQCPRRHSPDSFSSFSSLPLASLAPVFLYVPVWPTSRRPWPPPRSVLQGWCLGHVESEGLSRGRRPPSLHQVVSFGTWLEVVADGLSKMVLSKSLTPHWSLLSVLMVSPGASVLSDFVSQLAKAKARPVPQVLAGRARQA